MDYNPAMKNKAPADRRRAQWKVLTHRARRGKNAEAFLKNREKLLPVLEQMGNEGYHLQGDIFLSQILCANEQTLNKLICIECDIG